MRPYLKSFLLVCISSVGFASFSGEAAGQKDNRAAAIFGDQIITHQQVIDPIASELYEAEKKLYELKINQLKTQLLTRLISKNPLSKGLSADAFVQKYITKNPKVSDVEIEQFILANRIPKEKVDVAFKGKVRSFMLQQKNASAITSWLDSEGKKHGVIIKLQPPEIPRLEIAINGAPVQGSDNAPITIVEYSDFQCPYCARAEETIKEIQKNYKDKVRIVYKQFPLDFHKDAFRASEASLCANEQSSAIFWKLHDYMLANPKALTENNLIEQAVRRGAKKAQFSECLKSGKYVSRVQQEIDEGRRLGVQSTPMFFVNGITIRGAQPYPVFEKLIEEELARNSAGQ